jgi:excisionase family DNA binding protein
MKLDRVADYLNCHKTTLYRLIRSGELPAFRLGGGWRIRRSNLDEWIANMSEKAIEKRPDGRARR